MGDCGQRYIGSTECRRPPTKTLREFIDRYAQVLYLNPAYRFTDSRTRGLADIDASVSISNDHLRWEIANDRSNRNYRYAAAISERRKLVLALPHTPIPPMVVQTLTGFFARPQTCQHPSSHRIPVA
jgi:hypothetical protein